METGTIVIIAIIVVAVVVIAGGIAIAARSSLLPARGTTRLKKRFGAEYDHAVEAHGDAAAAERDLSERLRHRKNMKLRELSDQQRAAHTDTWAVVQQEFVDDPVRSVRSARGLVEAIMIDRGYPDRPASADDTTGFESRLRDLSVDHPAAVADFRSAHASGRSAEADQTGTEHMREELVSYRGLVEALLGGLPESEDTGHRGAPRPRAETKHPWLKRGSKAQR
ncbi:hypothetical protein [Nocardiopsis quinghaiensis]|uniref:hypothetical protein n=1 Tax=Nocardiopsis quinghaiensis TaxID=464995 RepID=UPI00123901E7|nr:hypothetical protein [Nocardiopsis quinghaiensis]